MDTQPLISISIPVFNEEHRIARAIESIQKQTYKNLEIIVIDDGSTDGTCSVVEKIAEKDPRVSLHHTPKVPRRTNWRGYDINAGFAARNYGFLLARGEWVTTQDADDASLLNRIEVQYQLAKKYNATLVTVEWIPVDDNLGKHLDVERMMREKGEDAIVVRPEAIAKRAKAQRGILMIEPLHQFIPFSIKWFPYTRKLFFRRHDSYPGADNSMLFHRSVLEQGFWFRPRNQRTYGIAAGRGTGRDFAYRVAAHFKNSWSFNLPMYLWDVKTENAKFPDYKKYFV